MGRKSRVHFRGAIYHVMLKSQAETIWLGRRSDREYWESLIEDGRQRFGHKIHAFCWMKNKASLCIEVGDVPLPQIVQNFSFRYTRYFNHKYDQTGPLFAGRYRAIVIEPEIYLPELVRYIHRSSAQNGNSAGGEICKYSSHESYLGTDSKPFLTKDRVLNYFGSRKSVALARFKKFVNSEIDHLDAIKFTRGTAGSQILGGPKFRKKVLLPAKTRETRVTLVQVIQFVCSEEQMQIKPLRSNSRDRAVSQVRQLICCIALELKIATLTDVASYFNRDLSTMSRNQRYFRENSDFDSIHRKKINRYKRELLKASR